MKEIVVFGTGDIAELALFYFSEDSPYTVVAFVVDEEYRTSDTFSGLPVVNFETVENEFPTDRYGMFIALAYADINNLRKQKFQQAAAKGYELVSYISSRATVLNQGKIGRNCFILEDNTIQPFVTIGDNVTLWSGNHVGHHSSIRDHVFIASHVVVSGGVDIGEQCFLGVNCTLRDHIRLGAKSIIGAGALILHDVEEHSLYVGRRTKRREKPSSAVAKI